MLTLPSRLCHTVEGVGRILLLLCGPFGILFVEFLAGFAHRVDIGLASGGEQPARSGTDHLCVIRERLGRVALRIDRKRQHQDISAYVLRQLVLHLMQIRQRHRARLFALRIHQVHQDRASADQVVIEAHALVFVRG